MTGNRVKWVSSGLGDRETGLMSHGNWTYVSVFHFKSLKTFSNCASFARPCPRNMRHATGSTLSQIHATGSTATGSSRIAGSKCDRLNRDHETPRPDQVRDHATGSTAPCHHGTALPPRHCNRPRPQGATGSTGKIRAALRQSKETPRGSGAERAKPYTHGRLRSTPRPRASQTARQVRPWPWGGPMRHNGRGLDHGEGSGLDTMATQQGARPGSVWQAQRGEQVRAAAFGCRGLRLSLCDRINGATDLVRRKTPARVTGRARVGWCEVRAV